MEKGGGLGAISTIRHLNALGCSCDRVPVAWGEAREQTQGDQEERRLREGPRLLAPLMFPPPAQALVSWRTSRGRCAGPWEVSCVPGELETKSIVATAFLLLERRGLEEALTSLR